MKSIYAVAFALCAAVLVSFASAAPIDPRDAQTLLYENENIGIDGYQFAYETSDGKSFQEKAVLENLGTEEEGIAVSGSYSYLGDDGQTYSVSYIADKNGFQPQGAHLPVA